MLPILVRKLLFVSDEVNLHGVVNGYRAVVYLVGGGRGGMIGVIGFMRLENRI
jgi:hypothetical protein